MRRIEETSDCACGHSPGWAACSSTERIIVRGRSLYASSRNAAARAVAHPDVDSGDGRSSSGLDVTGGAGFIGSHLTRMLLERWVYAVRILENFTYGDAGIAGIRGHPRLEVVHGDICNLRDVGRAMRDVDGVIALAAIVGDPARNIDPEETINLNYSATRRSWPRRRILPRRAPRVRVELQRLWCQHAGR